MRAAARIKMGYYPTPSVVVDQIRERLLFPDVPFPALDPCCGTGEALAELVKGTKAKTHGIELDASRATQAEKTLDRMLRRDFLGESRISPGAFSLILLNPPYDHDAQARRIEARFFFKTVPLLAEGGVMVLIVPAESLVQNERLCWSIGYHLEDVSVFPFPGKEFEAFHQVVVMGKKRTEAGVWGYDDGLRFQVRRLLHDENWRDDDSSGLPWLPVPAGRPPRVFQEEIFDPKVIEEVVKDSPLWEETTALAASRDLDLGRPPLPFRKGHLALLLACGFLDGIVGEGEERRVVKGYVKKEVTTTVEEHDGERVTRETENFVVAIKTLDSKGDIQVLT